MRRREHGEAAGACRHDRGRTEATLSRAGRIKLNPFRVVSWDVDGTLYSASRLKWLLLGMFAREVAGGRGGAARRELAELRLYRARVEASRSAAGLFAEALREGAYRERLLELEGRWYGRALARAGPHPGVADLLAFLSERGIPQVVLSDYRAEYKLEALGLRDRFASVYEGERLGHLKPGPRAFERVAADFGVETASLLHIGDRADTDGAGARAAGCQCLILGRDFRSFSSLLGRLRRDL